MATSTSNPLTRSTTADTTYKAEVNFSSNFSFICGRQDTIYTGHYYIGYRDYSAHTSTLIYNNSGKTIKGLYVYTKEGWVKYQKNNQSQDSSSITVRIPGSNNAYTLINLREHNIPELYNYIRNNEGKQLYFYVT